MNQYFNSYMKIDTDTVAANFQKVQEYIGKDVGIIPVVKGNCYGYGLVPMAKLFEERCGARLIATAAVCEAVELRRAGGKMRNSGHWRNSTAFARSCCKV